MIAPRFNILEFIDLGFTGYSTTDYFRFAATAFGPPALVLAIVFLQPWVEPAVFVLDPMAIAQDPARCCAFYSGAVSNLGIILWASAAAIAIFAACAGAATTDRTFLLATAAFTAILMVDDLFMLHEDALPSLGVPELAVMGGYLGVAAAYGLTFFKKIVAGRAALALLAAGLMAASVIEDQTKILWPIHDLIEDGAKFTGIYCWFVFVVLRSRDAIFASNAAGRTP